MNSLNMKPTSVFGLLVFAFLVPGALTSRERRQAQPLTTKQKTELVDHHNLLRRKEGANNMEILVGHCYLLYNEQASDLFQKRTLACSLYNR